MSRSSTIAIPKFWRGALVIALASAAAIAIGSGRDSFADDKEEEAKPAAEAGIVRFGHELHKGKGVTIEDCQQCHGIKGFEIEPVTRGKDHQPCNTSGCHASEYMSREPKICVVCHETNEPWVKQTARIRDLPTSEFGGEISHKTHQSDKASKGGVKCQSCHGNVFVEGEKPEAHAVCGSCHQGGLKPLMSDCGDCHKLGYQAQRLKAATKYTVRARFNHGDHDRDPREKSRSTPDCKMCHSGVKDASTLAEIPRPTMQSCDACHDGKHAFKTDGVWLREVPRSCSTVKLGALATGAATTTLVLGAVVTLTPAQSTEALEAASSEVPPLKFDHEAHAALDNPVDVDACGSCHGNDNNGVLAKPAIHGHQPCLAAGCHAEDFLSVGKRTKKDAPERYKKAAGFCLGCHDDKAGNAPSPFAKAEADNLYRNNANPGHYIEMNHLAHTKVAASAGGCRTCHVVDAESFELAPEGPGHAECSACHNGNSRGEDMASPEFAMGDCGDCHTAGEAASYFKPRKFSSDVRSCNSKRYAALSKRRKAKIPCFKHEHEGHRVRKSGEAVQCGHCHFMFSSKKYEGHGYETLLQIKQAPLMDNSRDRAHAKCGTSGCHRSAVNDSQGTGRCAMCHSSKSVLDSLVGGGSSRTTETPLFDSGEEEKPKKKRRKRKRDSLDGLVN